MSRKQITPIPTELLHNEAPPTSNLTSGSLQLYLIAATSKNTRKTYRSAIRQFEKWGGRLPTDTNTVIRYIVERAGKLNPSNARYTRNRGQPVAQLQGIIPHVNHL